MSGTPDFGMLRTESMGVILECRAIAPGLSLHDLIVVFEAAKSEAKPGDEFAGNPSKWPDIRGIKAVTAAVVRAMQNRADGAA